MKKRIIIIFLCTMLFIMVSSLTEANIIEEKGRLNFKSFDILENRYMWDLQFQYEVGELSGSNSIVGIEFDGTNFFVPSWQDPTIYKFDRNGNYLGSFSIQDVPNIIDLAYDGKYFYGAGQSPGYEIYIMDMENQTLIDIINAPVVAWNIAYDAYADNGNGGFWIGQWDYEDVTLIDRSGNTLDSFPPPESMFGLAWDNMSKIEGYNGPFLWIFTGVYTGDDGIIKVVDLATKTIIPGIEHNVADDLGQGIAGGLGFTNEWDSNYTTLFGIIQSANEDNYAFGYETYILNSPPDVPQKPSGPEEGATFINYTFATKTTDPEGDDLFYLFNWGDGTISDWIGPYKSEEDAEVAHTWINKGVYNIRVKARDRSKSESNWSESHTITIINSPTLEIGKIYGGLFKIKADIKNVGDLDAFDVNWSIELDGGAFSGKKTMGSGLNILAGGSKTITSKLIFGFGPIVLTVDVWIPESSDKKEPSGFVLFFFITVNPGG
jgi:hypothetical protein